MEVSASISFIWQLASYEAIAGEFKEILPEHFFLAMLKFAEIPREELEKAGAGEQAVQALVADVEAIRNDLRKQQIDPAALRRALRPALGKGRTPFEGGELHRAPASREYFDKAAVIASDARCDVLRAQHLFGAFLSTPTPLITKFLGKADLKDPRMVAADMPLLAKHGKDLGRLATNAPGGPSPERAAEARAVIQGLLERQRRCVLLVTGNPDIARRTVERVAWALAGESAPPDLAGKRLIDVSETGVAGDEGKAGRERILAMFAEAAKAKNVILFVPPLEAGGDSSRRPDWEETLRTGCLASGAPFIARLALPLHERISRDPAWRKAARIITIQDRIAEQIPDVL
jgi:ATP-dependent Clp protease ATP-binding subunit ClpA